MEGHVLQVGTENRDSKRGSRMFEGLWEFVAYLFQDSSHFRGLFFVEDFSIDLLPDTHIHT